MKAWIPVRFVFLLMATFLLSEDSSAQNPIRVSFAGAVFKAGLDSERESEHQQLSGFCVGGIASLSKGRLGIGLRYLEGSLNPDGDGIGRDLVEGELMLGVQTLSWLAIRLGPHLRSFITDGAVERWVFWEGRLRTETGLGVSGLSSYLELWHVLSASSSVDWPEAYDGGKGLEGGIRMDVSQLPFWLGLAYRIDRSNLGGGVRQDVLEHMVITVGFGPSQGN